MLTFLGAEQVTLADLLIADGERAGVGAALAERAAATKHDYADFHGLPGSSQLTEALGHSRLQLIVRAEAPVLELDGLDWDTYYATRLSSNQRALHRRRMRQLAKLGTIETTVARTAEELAPALEEAFELHALRWQGRPDRSDFGSERGKQFHREATAAMAELDVPRIVTLKLDGRPIAFAYYFALERTMCCHRLAFDPDLQRLSPGLVNRYDTLANAFGEGATRVEFFGGMERYKMELTDRTEPLHEGLGPGGERGGQGRRLRAPEQRAAAPVRQAVAHDSPLLLRGAGAGPATPPLRERVVNAAFYLAKAGSTRARSAAWLMRTRGRLDTSGLRILFYHRVSHDRDELAVAPDSFAEQMDYLASEAYRVVDVLTAIDLLDSGKPLARTVAMTFDDGFLDVAEHALPILSERGFHATVFVAPAVTDGRASFSWYSRSSLRSWTGTTSSSSTATARSGSRPIR